MSPLHWRKEKPRLQTERECTKRLAICGGILHEFSDLKINSKLTLKSSKKLQQVVAVINNLITIGF